MKEIIQKISSYDIFNNLLPGIIFVTIINMVTTYTLIQENIFIGIFFYYFIGSVISRLGSIIIEPIFRRFMTFAHYHEYISAAKSDPDIKMLLEKNNMFRSLIALFSLLIFAKLYNIASIKWTFLASILPWILITSIVVIFGVAYVKQTAYVFNRINNHKKDIKQS